MPAKAIDVVDLCAGYGQTVVIEDVSLSLAAGECFAILGRNGMGKSTLLNAIMGVNTHHRGKIRVGGSELARSSTESRALLGLGIVPQSRDIFPSLTVEENLRAGLKGRPWKCLEEAYALFPRLSERKQNLGWQLSGGEQQMLSTARTLLGRPSVLLLDEPLEGLAPVVCDEFMGVLGQLAASASMTIVLVEQRLELALSFASRALILERGRVCWSGSSQQLRTDHRIIDRHIGVGSLH